MPVDASTGITPDASDAFGPLRQPLSGHVELSQEIEELPQQLLATACGMEAALTAVSGMARQRVADIVMPDMAHMFPQLRFMGSKARLLPWVHGVFAGLSFRTALDAFSGAGSVAYLLKTMGKQVVTNDFLNFPATIARAIVANDDETLRTRDIDRLLQYDRRHPRFIEKTFRGIFYTPEDLRFLDRVSGNLPRLSPGRRAVAMAALIRSCVKRQPRGVFTVSGDLSKYDDGRRDLQLSLAEHFCEQVEVYNACVFSNGRQHQVLRGDVFDVDPRGLDLVYLDPPYVPRSDDNCYMKRYHFLEGLSCYWRDVDIMWDTKVRKIAKPYTPFSYRRSAIEAFDRLFRHFRRSTIVLSYSSNGFPDLDVLVDLLGRHKSAVTVHQREHRYHFGNHQAVERAEVDEYLIVGQ